MDRPVGPVLRWARAAVLALVATGSGVVAHASAGGRLPGTVALVVLLVVCTTGAARFLARPASTLRIVVLVIVGQTFIHGMLTAMVGHRGDPPLTRAAPAPAAATAMPSVATSVVPGADGHRVGSLADIVQAGRPPTAPAQLTIPVPVQHLIADFTGPHALMAVAHLLAAVALGCWLARGERLLWRVLTVTAAALSDVSVDARAGARSLVALVVHAARAAAAAHHLHVVRRRWLRPGAVTAARGRILALETGLRGPPYAVRG